MEYFVFATSAKIVQVWHLYWELVESKSHDRKQNSMLHFNLMGEKDEEEIVRTWQWKKEEEKKKKQNRENAFKDKRTKYKGHKIIDEKWKIRKKKKKKKIRVVLILIDFGLYQKHETDDSR